jgi:hypothetical protein
LLAGAVKRHPEDCGNIARNPTACLTKMLLAD